MDPIAKQSLSDKLQGFMKKANSNIKTAFTAEKDDYKVVIYADCVKQYHKGVEVGSTKVSEFDQQVIDYVEGSPNEAAQDLLDGFIKTYDPTEKTAASSTQSKETYQKTTQKQLDDQKVSLHPRDNEYYKNITQKQLPEHGQRPGTYDQITEGQFRDERKTFYGDDRTAGDWKQEDRNTITESQFVDESTQNDRGTMGSKFDGELDKQHHITEERQLSELLKHHEWTIPMTITEGPDQLAQQDGELSRLTAEVASKIIKESLNAMGNTVLSAGVTPSDLSSMVKKLVSHPSKYPVLAHIIKAYAGSDISVIQRKVAKAQHFGKTANTNIDYSDSLIADVLVRQLSNMSYNPKFIVNGLVALAGDENFENKINQASEECINCATGIQSEEIDVFKQALNPKDIVEGSDDDGMYSYKGPVSEVKASIKDKDAFAKAAAEYARTRIITAANKDVDLVPKSLDVNEEKGEYQIVFMDQAKVDQELTVRAKARRNLVKEASTKTAQMGGGGAMPPTGSPEMGNPAMPPGGGDMGAPPAGEALSQQPPMPEEEEEAGTGEPQPPGSICPACGSQDVDLDSGELRCNNCGAEGHLSVRFDLSKWPTVLDETTKEEDEGFGLGAEDAAAAGETPSAEIPEASGTGDGTTLPNVPVGGAAASVKIKNILNKVASKQIPVLASTYRITPKLIEKIKEQKISMGGICPNCGGHETDAVKSANRKGTDGICWDCGQEYGFRVTASKSKKNNVYAQYIWSPIALHNDCPGCNRLVEAFDTSLKNYGTTRKEFDNIKTMKEKGELVVKMAKAGSLDLTKAMNSALPMSKYAASARWKGYDKFDKFPSASCMERLSRRFGENATAMSGPCQGAKLAECVCKQLEGLGIYTDGLAAKVASVISDKDPMVSSPMKTCIAMFVRDGLDVEDACTACDGLRAAYADVDDLVIEAIAQVNPYMPKQPQPQQQQPQPKPQQPLVPEPGTTDVYSPKRNKSLQNVPPASANTMMSPMEEEPGDIGGDIVEDATDIGENLEGDTGFGDEIGGMGDEMGEEIGGMGDDFGGEEDFGMDSMGDFGDEGLDTEMGGGDTVTIQIPRESVDAVKVLMDALLGQIGDDTVDTTGDDGFGGGGMEEIGIGGQEEESGIPGLMDESPESELGEEPSEGGFGEDSIETETPSEELSESPEEQKNEEFSGHEEHEEHVPEDHEESDHKEEDSDDDSKDMLKKKTNESKDCGAPCAKPMESEKSCPTCKKPMTSNDCSGCKSKEQEVRNAQTLENMLLSMKTSSMKTQKNALDSLFDGIIQQAVFTKQAKANDDIKKVEYKSESKGDKVNRTPAQDSTDVKYQDGGKIGHEKAFTDGVKKDPDVPRGKATIGEEGDDLTVNDKTDLPTVPHGAPLMEGEKHFKPEQGNVIDGNQGSQTTAKTKVNPKTAGKPMCPKGCGKPVWVCNGKCSPDETDKDGKPDKSDKPDKSEKESSTKGTNMKTSNSVWTVAKGHKYYNALSKKANAGQNTVKLQDNKTYSMTKDQNGSFILIAQTVTPKKVDSLVDDPDINNSSGAGRGKVKEDKTHSLAVTEQKPSEGVSKPQVPEAPNSGQLSREHTYDTKLNGPTIPAGGGMNSEYDQNDKNTPEKMEQMLGLQNGGAALASRDEAIKVAGRMVKCNLITIDQLSEQVTKLSKATPEILKDYDNMIANASKGMQKESSNKTVETDAIIQRTTATDKPNLTNDIQSLFRLDQRNKDHERYTNDKGDTRLFH